MLAAVALGCQRVGVVGPADDLERVGVQLEAARRTLLSPQRAAMLTADSSVIWRAASNCSSGRFFLNTTHCMTPVPSRRCTNCRRPLSMRFCTQPVSVTSWPTWSAARLILIEVVTDIFSQLAAVVISNYRLPNVAHLHEFGRRLNGQPAFPATSGVKSLVFNVMKRSPLATATHGWGVPFHDCSCSGEGSGRISNRRRDSGQATLVVVSCADCVLPRPAPAYIQRVGTSRLRLFEARHCLRLTASWRLQSGRWHQRKPYTIAQRSAS